MTILNNADSVVVDAAAGGLVAFVVTLLLVPLTIRLARRLGIVDEPGARSSHQIETPRLGGIGVAAGALTGLAVTASLDPAILDRAVGDDLPLGLVLGLTAALFGFIGLTDDLLRGIPVAVRLVAQLVIGAAMIMPWVLHRLADDDTSTMLTVVVAGAAAVWVIGYVNAFNFMDGVDGMSGFVAIVVGLDFALVGAIDDRAPLVVAGIVLTGAAAGFLPLNLRPTTVFLGDGGSYFLGAWIATAVVIGIGLDSPPEALLAVTAPYLADTATTLLRRLARQADWRASHHEHAYQQMIDLGYSHPFVSGTVAGASALCAALGMVSLVAGPAARTVAAIGVVAVAAAYVATPGALRRRLPVVPAPLQPATRHAADQSDRAPA